MGHARFYYMEGASIERSCTGNQRGVRRDGTHLWISTGESARFYYTEGVSTERSW
jgi:hypothetical protein